MAERMTVARYDDAGGFAELKQGVDAISRTMVSGQRVETSVVDRGDGTATVTASGPSDLVYALIEYVDVEY